MGANEEKKRNRLLWIILIFIMLITFVSNKALRNRTHDLFYNNDKSLQLVKNININWPQSGKVKVYNDKIIRYDTTQVAAYDLEGTLVWKKAINDSNSKVYFGESRVYVAYTDNGKITAFDINGKQIWDYDAKKAITRIAEENRYIILFTKAGENIEQVNIIDDKGKLQANTTINNRKILSCSISPKHKGFTLVTLDLSNGSINSSLSYYEMDGQEVWRKDYNDQMIYDVLFLDNNSMIVICDNKIINLSVKNDILWSRAIEGGLKDIDVDVDSKIIYILSGQAKPNLEMISTNGRTKNKIELDNYYDNIYINKKYILLKGNKNIAGINDEKIYLKYNCEQDIKELGLYDDNVLIFTSQNTMITKLVSVNDQKR